MNTIIPHRDYDAKQINSRISAFFKKVYLARLLRKANIRKLKGFSCLVVFQFIFQLIFTGKNFYQLLESDNFSPPFAKDVVYDFLNSVSYNWRKFLLLLSSKIIKSRLYPLTSEDRVNVLIFDDSLYSRARSKAVELLARVHDHSRGKYVKGFRLLTMGWSDGNSFIPVAFSLLSSKKEKNRINDIDEDIDKRTNGYKRRQEALKKATEVMFDLLEGAIKYCLPVDYVLFDSWFAYPSIIKKVFSYEIDVVCRLKSMYRVYYDYKGRKLNLDHLYQAISKKQSKGRIIASVIVGLGTDENDNEVKAKIVFVRDDNDKNNWVALLSTDTSLEAEEIIRIYGKRWDIEVFFKMNKQYLRLSEEFQGRSYDMMFAHTTIVFTRYILLALENRKTKDSRTFGGIFFDFCDEMEDIRFAKALLLIIDLIKETVNELMEVSEEKVNDMLDYFIDQLPGHIKKPLGILASES